METPSKPTSMTKLDKIFMTWDEYCDARSARDDSKYPNGRHDGYMYASLSDLRKLNVVFSNFRTKGCVGGCIILVRPL